MGLAAVRFCWKYSENITAVMFHYCGDCAFLFLELSDRRWGLSGEVCQNDRAFILSVFRRFFAFFQKTRKNAFRGGNFKMILRSDDVYAKMMRSRNWIFEIRWGLSEISEVWVLMRFGENGDVLSSRWGLWIGDVFGFGEVYRRKVIKTSSKNS
mgnify:FL=1